MSTTVVRTPTSRCRIGVDRCDVTPPVGIYHRFWGAAKHDRATGVHRPLTATVLAFEPLESQAADDPWVIVAVDHCLFRPADMDQILEETSSLIGVDRSRVSFFFSHTHSAGHINRERSGLPGGDKLGPYLDSLPAKIAASFRAARESMQPATLTYATAKCDMGHNRDYWDAESNRFVCGFNPEADAGLPVHVVRVTDDQDRLIATAVNYPCHPTTLAWDNTLISPDYIGAMREVVEQSTDAPCVFLLAPCGDIGPKDGYVGNVEVADRNGRQLGYAALSALESMPPAATDFHYVGPVLSGATLGAWEHRPLSEQRRSNAADFRHRHWDVPLSYLPNVPTVAEAERDLDGLLAQETAARVAGNLTEAQQARALAERKRRLLERIRPLPEGDRYPLQLEAWQLGDAIWVAIEGEPYCAMQEELTARFPSIPLILMPLANGARSSYLPTRAAYDKPLYQVDVSLLAAGCLEAVTESIAKQIEGWIAE